MAKKAFTTTRTDWNAVAREVSRRLGKLYAGQYVNDVARGWRSNSRVRKILLDLDLIKEDARAVAA